MVSLSCKVLKRLQREETHVSLLKAEHLKAEKAEKVLEVTFRLGLHSLHL